VSFLFLAGGPNLTSEAGLSSSQGQAVSGARERCRRPIYGLKTLYLNTEARRRGGEKERGKGGGWVNISFGTADSEHLGQGCEGRASAGRLEMDL